MPFSCFNNTEKGMLLRFLVWQLLWKRWVTAADHSANDELQLQISTGDHCSLANRSSRRKVLVQSQKLHKNCRNHPASNIMLEFFIWRVTYLLKNNRTSTTPIEENDLWLLPIICEVTVRWETTKACFFRNKTWKSRQKDLKICSCEGKNLWSFY
jgi:hypothetical protein